MAVADAENTANPAGQDAFEAQAELETLAARVAASHARTERIEGVSLPLLENIDALEALLVDAQRVYAATDSEHAISYAGEWLLDNFYIVQQALRQIEEDIPPAYYAELPKLTGAALQGFPRVYAIAAEITRWSVNPFSREYIERFVNAYQAETPLTMGELWALPTMLRVVSLENLIWTAAQLTGITPDQPVFAEGAAPDIEAEDSHVANAILNLRMLATQDWKAYFEAVSYVEQLLRQDPAHVYKHMDFVTRNRYRRTIEILAPDTAEDEERVAQAALTLAAQAAGDNGDSINRAAHIGYYLIGDGLKALKAAIGYRPSLRDRLGGFGRARPTLCYFVGIAILTLAVLIGLQAIVSAAGAGFFTQLIIGLLALIPATAVGVNVTNWLVSRAVTPQPLPKMDFRDGIPPQARTMVVIPALLTDDEETQSLAEQLEMHYLRSRDPHLTYALLLDFTDAATQTLPADVALIENAQNCIEALNERHGAGGHAPFYLFARERRWNDSEGVWMGWERKRGKLAEFNTLVLHPDADTSYTVKVGDLSLLNQVRFVITLDADTVLPKDAAHRLIATLAHPLNRPYFDDNGQVTGGYTVLQPRIEIIPTAASKTLFTRTFAGDIGYDLYTLAVSDVYQDAFGEAIFTGKGIYDVAAFERSVANTTPENAILSHDLFEGIHGRAALVTDVVLLEDYPPHYLVHTRRLHRWIRGDWQLLPWLRGRVPLADGTTAPTPLSVLDRWKLLDNLRRSLVAPTLLAFIAAGWLLLPSLIALWTVVALAVSASPFFVGAANMLLGRLRGGSWEGMGHHLQTSGVRWWLSLIFLPHEAYLSVDAIARTIHRLRTRKNMLQWTTAAVAQRSFNADSLAAMWGEMTFSSLFAVGIGLLLVLNSTAAFYAAAPPLVLWYLAPLIAYVLSRPASRPEPKIEPRQQTALRGLARRTWLFFERYVGPDDHWLPPDHFQETPRGIIAHHTSPTNIGLFLLSSLSAYDFGYMGLLELSARLKLTFETLEKLPRHRGHFLNWYDTRTLAPLPPSYVSTVDSGNLACCFIALRQALKELHHARLMRPKRWDGLSDILTVLDETLAALSGARNNVAGLLRRQIAEMQAQIAAVRDDPSARMAYLTALSEKLWPDFTRAMLESLENQPEILDMAELSALRAYIERVGGHLNSMRRDAAMLVPWLPLLENPPALFRNADDNTALRDVWPELLRTLPRIPSLADAGREVEAGKRQIQTLCAYAESANAPANVKQEALAWCGEVTQALDSVIGVVNGLISDFISLEVQIEGFCDEMDFRFLYDRRRKLFHIGYNVSVERLDANYYDLLASEARLASLFAVATGQVPQEHWMHLGRPQTRIGSTSALLSWSGTMFEYLMPLLLMRNTPDTLLDQTYTAVVEAQIRYGRQNGVPWGISESGYYAFDGNQNYQYRAFGVPTVAFKRGLAADMVIAPYASMIALPVNPQAVIANMKALTDSGGLGQYGFYEAIDYTESRLELGEQRAVVREYMAHHQGMILLTLSNMLTSAHMAERFHADPRVQAVDLLLQEQVPQGVEFEYPSPEEADPTGVAMPHLNASPWTAVPNASVPQLHYLSNGRYGVVVTSAGGGYSQWNATALTRWRADTTLDDWGTWIYVRDQSRGAAWSAAFQPTQTRGDSQMTVFSPHRVQFQRRDHDISMEMDITVPPDDDLEIRRVRLTNLSDSPRRLLLSSYGEVVLGSQDGDRRHPAFNKMFVESEFVTALDALVFRRRPRSAEEEPPFMLHMLVTDSVETSGTLYETDRAKFVGRNRTPKSPAALTGSFTGSTGGTLDPVMALGREVELQPQETIQLAFVTAAAATRTALLTTARSYQNWATLERAFAQARYRSELEMRQLDVGSPDIQQFQKMLSALLYPQPNLRAATHTLAANSKGQSGLWAHGISGDYPIIVLRVGEETETAVVRELVQAHRYWRNRQIKTTLVILNQRDTGYTQELYNQVHRLISRMGSETWINRHDGIFLLRADLLNESDQTLLAASARVSLDAKNGSLARQLEAAFRQPVYLPAFMATLPHDTYDSMPPLPRPGDLAFDNGFGGFTPDGADYVIFREPGSATPAPWTNVIANEDFGFTVSESGGGYSWSGNSSENRLTGWRNDPVTDMPSEAVYLRDEETAQIWSPTPLPAGTQNPYLVRHGKGYSTFEHHSHSLIQRMTLFAAPDAQVKVVRLRLENTSDRARRITATYFAEWVLGTAKDITQQYIVPEFDQASQTLLFRNPYSIEFGGHYAFLSASKDFHGLTTDRAEFLGRLNGYESPAALARIGLSGAVQAGADPCAAIQIHIDLPPNGAEEVFFILGAGESRAAALKTASAFRDAARVETAWQASGAFWRETLSQTEVQTPDAAMNLILPWLLYQALSCRIWGRSALYQSGGAYGFRDQLQDVMALVHTHPNLTREQILRAARHQFEAGDVLHWWHPPSGRGVRTRFSDDLVWLPFVTAFYVKSTGDTSILDEKVPFLKGEPLKPEEEERYGQYEQTAESFSIYEHCRRAISRASTSGAHGLPLMGAGDWNDGMSRVGIHGKGESVWMGWFLYATMTDFMPLAESISDLAQADAMRRYMDALQLALEAHAWDGDWYLRAFYDDGTPLGSAQNMECRIDSLSQSWAVISKAGDPARARQAMAAVKTHLVKPEDRILLLFTPPFDKTPHDPGYIKGYAPGIRENGGQYTHAAIWTAWAFAELGDGDEAAALFGMLNPINHADTPEKSALYRVEPYVIAADVYGAEPHVGRGGWTWYTGSSGWYYRLGIEAILGIQREGDTLRIDPRIPKSWTDYTVSYRHGGTVYRIRIENPDGVSSGVARVVIDGVEREDRRIPLAQHEGGDVQITVTMGTPTE